MAFAILLPIQANARISSSTKKLMHNLRYLRTTDITHYQQMRAMIRASRGDVDSVNRFLYKGIGRAPLHGVRLADGGTKIADYFVPYLHSVATHGHPKIAPMIYGDGWYYIDSDAKLTWSEIENIRNVPLHKVHIAASNLTDTAKLSDFAGWYISSNADGFKLKVPMHASSIGRPDAITIYHANRGALERLAQITNVYAWKLGITRRNYLLTDSVWSVLPVEFSKGSGHVSRLDLLHPAAKRLQASHGLLRESMGAQRYIEYLNNLLPIGHRTY